MNGIKNQLLRKLPSVAALLEGEAVAAWLAEHPRPLVTDCLREALGDIRRQIEDTIKNVCAIFDQQNCPYENVVQVMAYCKTREVKDIFKTIRPTLPWPWVTLICDVCRDDLLFEIEASAVCQ